MLGTLWLVLGGVRQRGARRHLHPRRRNLGIGLLGVSLAFGLTVVTGAYALGHISGGHFNPAITLGVLTARRIEAARRSSTSSPRSSGPSSAAAIVVVIANGVDGFSRSTGESSLAANGFADHSPGGYDWGAASSPRW